MLVVARPLMLSLLLFLNLPRPARPLLPASPSIITAAVTSSSYRCSVATSSSSFCSSSSAASRLAFCPTPARRLATGPRSATVSAEDEYSGASFDDDDVDTAVGGAGGYDDEEEEGEIPDLIANPVLRSVYPALMWNVRDYGHPNIPLGTRDGRMCRTLRRLQFQDRLDPAETDLLVGLGFRFTNFEDVYEEADFDDCLERLIKFEEENPGTKYQVPKKYKDDPELGAWVTMIRRMGREGVEEGRRDRLDDIGFSWISTRKCGSAFMSSYRSILERLKKGGESAEDVLGDESARKWLKAQRKANELGNISEQRVGYLDELTELGVCWREL